MRIKEITDCLENLAPLAFQEDYDNAGLLTGDVQMDCAGILITLDISMEVMEEALQNGCNLIISHHPLVFKPMKKLTGNLPGQHVLIKAIKNDIAIYSIHTNIDNASHGLNRFVAEKLRLINLDILQPKEAFLAKLVTYCPVAYADKVRNALFDAGAGNIGNYDQCSYNLSGQGTFRASGAANPFVGERNKLHTEDEIRMELVFPVYLEQKLVAALLKNHPYEEVAYDIYPLKNLWNGAGSGIIGELPETEKGQDFIDRVKFITGIPVVRYSGEIDRNVKKVAICTGSGSFLIPDALMKNADIYLTSDIKYHDFFEPRDRMILADIGHYESEQFVKELISSILIEKFPNFAILSSKKNTNPVNYY